MKRIKRGAVITLLLGIVHSLVAHSVVARQSDVEFEMSEILFTRRIAPLLQEKCVACHGQDPAAMEGGLDLRSLASLLVGGDSGGPGVVPGKPLQSPIYLAAAREELQFSAMPPKEAEKLTEAQLRWLHDWIQSGASWPEKERQSEIRDRLMKQWVVEDGESVSTSGGLTADWTNRLYDPAGLWAYRPVNAVSFLDSVAGPDNPIDRLIEQSMPEGLNVAPRASRRELLRRATFDLTGLPPSPEEMEAFLSDRRSDVDAFSSVVDRLLQSPHYGERMAQHWLDVVRYADSAGFANDYDRGNAWRYRDYVVRSFNEDKPYDQFVREQIAGDELMPDDPEGVIAVGFLRMGPWELTAMEVERVARQRFLDDVTNSVGETFLGHSLQCARCHDHKFDPIPTRDYYAVQAVFAATQLAERPADFLQEENREGFDEQRFLLRMKQAHLETQNQLHAILEANAKQWFEDKLAESEGEQRSKISEYQVLWDKALAEEKKRVPKPGSPFDAVRNRFMRLGIAQDQFPPRHVGFTPRQYGLDRVASKGLQRLVWELDRYQPFAHSVYNGHTPKLFSVDAPLRMPSDTTQGKREETCIRTGGDPFAEGETVSPGTLSVIDKLVPMKIPAELEGRRTAFANWVADERNPLTTRVIVNRVWQWHFGKAIAGNPNNLGSTGGRPTHPELLDYLASTFIKSGWSIKRLSRQIMISDVYCRSTHYPNPELLAELDPLSTSWAVFQPRRLSAEELRDSMLAATGELNRTIGGIPCRPEINMEVAMQPRQVMGTFASAWVPNPEPERRHRRSIYVWKLRGVLPPMLEVFNTPTPDFSCERREASTVTPQVFSLFNSRNSYSRALALANRAWRESEGADGDLRDAVTLRRCFQLTYCRPPSEREVSDMISHWKFIEAQVPVDAGPDTEVPLQADREAIEENTGQRFTFSEPLFANREFQPDLQPTDVDRHIRALGDICLVLLNSNEFVYVY